MKLFKNSKPSTRLYKIAFCDENDLATKFGEWNGVFDSYEAADFFIRMNWSQVANKKVNDGYPLKDSWLIIE